MEGCLLCLDLKQSVDSIGVNSDKWEELNIKNVLEKYLWPMSHIEATSLICITCWSELYDFHKFYMRIQKAHGDFGLFTKNMGELDKNTVNSEEIAFNELTENRKDEFEENPVDKLVETSDLELKYFLNEYDFSDNSMRNDLMIKEQKPIIKHELHEDLISHNNVNVQKRKRGRPRKEDQAALNKNKKYKNQKIEDMKNTKRKTHEIHVKVIKKTKENTTDGNSEIKLETDLLPVSEEAHSPHDNDSDSNNNTDQEYLCPIESTKIKHRSINTNYPPKINHNEKDKFLAENFKITCFLCNIPFETFFNMLKHFETHHTELGHVKCCNKKFYKRSILVDHVHYHLNPNYFKCSQCGKVMADRRCLEVHAENHKSNLEKIYCCDICGKGFSYERYLQRHRKIHLSEEEKRFICSNCGKNFASNYMLSNHYRSVHLKKYIKICDICGKSVRLKEDFERHMLQHEGKTAPSVSCDVCGLLLTDQKALKRHKGIIHPVGGQQEYTCSICSKTSPNLRAHKMHVQYKHVMGYDHKCTICDKAFKRAPTLKEHMASHTGTSLYTCPWCPKTFNSNANMHKHRKKVHPKEWERASRKRYSGNLPPSYKPPPAITEPVDFTATLDK